jgi:hypothetical protein
LDSFGLEMRVGVGILRLQGEVGTGEVMSKSDKSKKVDDEEEGVMDFVAAVSSVSFVRIV